MDFHGEMRDVECQVLVWKHIFGVVNSLVLKCAVKLNIFDTIHRHEVPITISELGASLSVPHANISILHRIMRYLAHMRLVVIVNKQQDADTDDLAYALAPGANLLLKGDERSLAPFVEFILDEGSLSPLHALDSYVYEDANVSSYDKLMGESVWAHTSKDAEFNKLLNKGMASRAAHVAAGMIEACRETFQGIRTLVDVGGGTGTMAQAIVGAFVDIKCKVLDLPHVVEGLPKCRGIDFVGGDMFDFVPPEDIALLMCVLHDWNDDKCLRILKRCKEAIPKDGGKLLIVDHVISDQAPEVDGLYNVQLADDIVMMSSCSGGRERTEKEWKELLMKAGFSGYKITPIKTVQHVIEAYP